MSENRIYCSTPWVPPRPTESEFPEGLWSYTYYKCLGWLTIRYLGEFYLNFSAADFNKDSPIKNDRTLNKHHDVRVVKDLSQNIPEVRKPGFQVPNLLGQLPSVQAMPCSCLTVIIQETHRAWNVLALPLEHFSLLLYSLWILRAGFGKGKLRE